MLVSGQNKIVTYDETVKDKVTGEEKKVEKTGPVIKETEKNLKLLADSWRMAQEVDKAIPVLEKAAKMSKDGKAYVLLGNLYLSEDKIQLAVDSIKQGLKKGKVDNISQVHLTLAKLILNFKNLKMLKKNSELLQR